MTKTTFAAVADDPVGTIYHDEQTEGLRIIVMRGPASVNAYIGVPDGHPLAGFDYDSLPNVEVHGGLTYASSGGKEWPKGWYWYGWDYAHAGDRSLYDAKIRVLVGDRASREHEWTPAEVIKEAQQAVYQFVTLARFAERVRANAVQHNYKPEEERGR